MEGIAYRPGRRTLPVLLAALFAVFACASDPVCESSARASIRIADSSAPTSAGTASPAAASAADSTLPLVLPGVPQIRLWTPDQVLSRFSSVAPDGARLFHQPDGVAVRLVETTDDELIVNPGDGEFHPMDVAEVERALAAVPQALLRELDADIFILPYPRADRLSSSAGRNAVYLSPGVRDYSIAQVHYVVTHEVGHLFHREHLPFENESAWDPYRDLRGMRDTERFHFGAPHADRPQEVFAEDFRVLFGGDLARGDGSIENHDLERPENVAGLRDFFLSLVENAVQPVAVSNWSLYPRPGRSLDGLTLRASDPTVIRRLDVYDVRGRRLGSPDALGRGPAEWTIRWNEPVSAGAYWVRVETVDREMVVLPVRVVSPR